MYSKEELTQCNHFGMVHTLTAFTGDWVEDISNSYPTFIKVLQPVTFVMHLFMRSNMSDNQENTQKDTILLFEYIVVWIQTINGRRLLFKEIIQR